MLSSPPHSRLIALTHCLRACIDEANWPEAKLLLAQREALIEELSRANHRFGEEESELIREADRLLHETAAEKKSALTARMRKIGSAKKLRSTYHVG